MELTIDLLDHRDCRLEWFRKNLSRSPHCERTELAVGRHLVDGKEAPSVVSECVPLSIRRQLLLPGPADDTMKW